MAVLRTCLCCALQGIFVVVNFAVAIGLTVDMDLTRQEITTTIGQPANLGCYANQTNSAGLIYSWKKGNLTITQSSNLRVYGNVLVVTPKENTDFGTYECHVSDGVTIATCSISLLPGCNNSHHEENLQGHAGCVNISVLMPVLAVTVVSLLLNVHFLVRWKRRDEWALSEEDIMQLQVSQQAVPIEDKSEEHVEIKKNKSFRERFRRRRRKNNENDQHIEENDQNHTDIPYERDAQDKNKQEPIEMQEILDIPSVAEIKAAEEAADEENAETAPAPSDTDRIPVDSETPRIADFFVPGDETDGETSGRESLDSELPLVSHYMEKMDFEGTGDSDDELVLK